MSNRHNLSRFLIVVAGLLVAGAAAGAPQQVHEPSGAWAPAVSGGETSRSPFLGVLLQEETDHGEGGARITEVVEDSPAERAGLEPGDIVVGFDEETIRGPVALTRRIRAAEAGATVRLTVLRDGKRHEIDVRLGQRPERWEVLPGLLDGLHDHVEGLQWPTVPEPDHDFRLWGVLAGRPKLGVQLVETTPELRRHLGASAEAGVLVSKVLPDSPAERGEIRVGDLIVAIDGAPIADVSAIRRAVQRREGQTLQVRVVRDGAERTLEVRMPEAEPDERPTGPQARLAPRAPQPPLPLAPPHPLPALAPTPPPDAPAAPAAPAPPRAPVAPPAPHVVEATLL